MAYDLVAEVLPEIEEAYKTTVCGYTPGVFDDETPSKITPKMRWAEAPEVWIPIPKNLLEDLTENLQAVCRKLTARKAIRSARFVEDDELPDNISTMMAGQDMAFLHVVCVPFKDLKVA